MLVFIVVSDIDVEVVVEVVHVVAEVVEVVERTSTEYAAHAPTTHAHMHPHLASSKL